ncbi:translation elongation factor Ts, partial [Coxiella endosymbiont of Amblyomma americanum]|uniref:translation elongation factor Ts n=1 Tax=Coxiella endosymbiont of Amblyomma americanum TaxID=325775 RepID=UPI00057DF5B1
MIITAAMVKALREITGAGIMSCKTALQVTNGNIEVAIQELKKLGEITATKLVEKKTKEGVLVIEVNDNEKKGFMVEVNCQTDFVARNEAFIKFAQKIARRGLKEETTNVADTLALTIHTDISKTIESARKELAARMGENIQVRRVALLFADGVIGHYVHRNRIGVLVALHSDKTSLAKDIAIHIAAFNPQVISSNDVSKKVVSKEKEILTAQAKRDGKPERVINRIVEGRLNKFLKEMSLEGQAFLKDSKISVGDLLQSEKSTVTDFIRFEVGA